MIQNLKDNILCHGLVIDGNIAANSMSVVTFDTDACCISSIIPFDGRETHSTVFVNGTLVVNTDGKGHIKSIDGDGIKITINGH